MLLEAERSAGAVLPEYHRATPECPNPTRWSMYDSMTAEVEVLEFLLTLVTTIKPRQIVETGAFLGASTRWMARGLEANGFGRLISCELDRVVFEKAQEAIAASGLTKWIDLRNQSSLDLEIEGTIDLLFSDSELAVREQEVRRFLPQVSPDGLVVIHDAGSYKPVVRDAVSRMAAEGLISAVFLPTPRGLVLAQKRNGSHLAAATADHRKDPR